MIEVHIPYLPGKRLNQAYNYYMARSSVRWVLFVDHDVYLALNPHWYDCCEKATQEADRRGRPGMITCMTNRIARKTAAARVLLLDNGNYDNDSMEWHHLVARRLWDTYGCSLEPLQVQNLPGFFMLVSVGAWRAVGGFQPMPAEPGSSEQWHRPGAPGFLSVDNWFSRRLQAAGRRNYYLPGLYVYHGYRRQWREDSAWQQKTSDKAEAEASSSE